MTTGLSRITLIALLAIALASCERNIESHGDLPMPDRLAQVEPGRTKSDVLALLGTPSSTFAIGTERWYYVSNQTEAFAIFPIEELERLVIVIDFDKSGKVTQIRKLGLKDGKEIDMASRVTPTTGQNMSILGQMIGNIGRFDSGDSTSK